MLVNSLRIGGLATGLDTNQIVKDLMRVENMPLDRLRQDRQLVLWRQQEYRDINRALDSFRDQVFSLGLQSTFLAKRTNSSNAAVTVAPLPAADEGLFELTVEQLAKGVYLASDSRLADDKDSGGSLRTLKDQFGLAEGAVISFALEGSARDGVGNYLQKSFLFDAASKTIADVVSEINQANLGIRAVYDSANDRLVLMSSSTGAAQRLKVVLDEELAPGVRFLSGPANLLRLPIAAPDGVQVYSGQDALVRLNGAAYNFSGNSFTLMGLSVTLNEGPERLGDPVIRSMISVANDTEAVFNTIENFVENYNELLERINDKLREPRYRDYRPLTEEQRAAMTDREIELWEERAKSGLLQNDSLLEGLLHRMRGIVSGLQAGMPSGLNSLAAIGISTGHHSEGGRLFLDPVRLREALAQDPEGIADIFTRAGQEGGPANSQGIGVALAAELDGGIRRLSAYAGGLLAFSPADQSSLGQEVSRLDRRILETVERLQKIEDRYWRRFTALERAIARMNSQSEWLAAQFMNQGS